MACIQDTLVAARAVGRFLSLSLGLEETVDIDYRCLQDLYYPSTLTRSEGQEASLFLVATHYYLVFSEYLHRRSNGPPLCTFNNLEGKVFHV